MIQGVSNTVRISENKNLKPHQMIVPENIHAEIISATRGQGFEVISGNDSGVQLPTILYNALVDKTEQAGSDTV